MSAERPGLAATVPPAPARAPRAAPARPGPVMGDGTTAAGRARSRWRRARWPLGVLGLLVVVALASVLPSPRTSSVALAPDNPGGSGARALAQVLGDQGVEIDYVQRTADAVDRATAGTTLLVTGDWLLTEEQVRTLAATGADLVLLDPDALLSAVAPEVEIAGVAGMGTSRVEAACDDPDAVAAGALAASGTSYLSSSPDVVTCFPSDNAGGGVVAIVRGERRVTVIGDAGLLTNARIADEGNAALALRALGQHEQLTWFVPSLSDTTADGGGGGLGDLLPPAAGVLGLQLLLVGLVAIVWRSRRLGRVVTEQLPVVVRSAETTRGRGRLYRAARARGHAGAALRAGAAARSAHRLGLPRSAGAAAVIEAVSRATGRPEADVAALLYGPPPTTDTGLALLARQLDQLESEVHRS